MDVQAFDEVPASRNPFSSSITSTSRTASEIANGQTYLGLARLQGDAAHDITLLLDSGQTIQAAAGAVGRILGRRSDTLVGQRLIELTTAGGGAGIAGPALAATQGQILPCPRPDGDVVLLAARFHPLHGASAQTVCVLRDVTAETRLAEQVVHLQRMDAIGQLTAGIAHDFNNLLQSMMGSLELLLDEIDDCPAARESAENALRTGERGARLTHHLLAFVRRQAPRPKPLPLAPLVHDIVHTLRRTLGPRIAIAVNMPAELPDVHADAGQLEAALLNLALNARDAMPQGGTLTIEVAPAVGAPPSGTSHVVIAASDTGTGMDAGILLRACEPFFSTKGQNGSGLGLSMVRDFARQSGGDLRIESTPGAGTRVALHLPIAPEPLAAATPATIAPAPARVLLVDDEPEVLVTLGSFLKGAGYAVRSVRSGDEALAALSAGETADVMVTDYAMPGLDGEALISQVRRIAPELPLLVVSGYSEAERLLEAVSRLRVLRKPFRRLALVQEVAALIEPS